MQMTKPIDFKHTSTQNEPSDVENPDDAWLYHLWKNLTFNYRQICATMILLGVGFVQSMAAQFEPPEYLVWNN